MEDLKEMFAQMMRFPMESQKMRKNSFNFWKKTKKNNFNKKKQKKTKKDFFSCYKEIRKRNNNNKNKKKTGKNFFNFRKKTKKYNFNFNKKIQKTTKDFFSCYKEIRKRKKKNEEKQQRFSLEWQKQQGALFQSLSNNQPTDSTAVFTQKAAWNAVEIYIYAPD